MRPDIVADVGNTRVKWGLVGDGAPRITKTASLPEDEAAWARQAEEWGVAGPRTWALASVRPARSERLRAWLEARGHHVVALTKAAQLPLKVGLAEPDKAGIDRLLNAVAAARELPDGRGAVLVGAGTAVTADWLDEDHVFRGGSIFPGLDLMAEALHRHAALLPLVTVPSPVPPLPGGATVPAMQVGLFLAVSGGIREAIRLYREQARAAPAVFFTGGQSGILLEGMRQMGAETAGFRHWPTQTLEGLLLAAEALP